MKSITKKVFIYIFCGLFTFSSTFICYYKSAHALEWAGGALAFEEALKWTLSVLGITATAGMTDAYWDEYGDEFVDYAIQDGATQAEVAEWQLKLCEGILDKASSVWISFKNWAATLPTSGSGSGSGLGYVDFSDALYSVNSQCNTSYSSSYSDDYHVYDIIYVYNSNVNEYCELILLGDAASVICSSGYLTINNSNYLRAHFHNNVHDLSFSKNSNGSFSIFFNSNTHLYITNNENFTINSLPTNNTFIDLISSGSSASSDFISVPDVDIPNIDVISADIPDEEDPEITLPFPGLDTSDDNISSDTYDDIIGAINDGTISIDEGIDDIIGRLRVLPYDEVTGDVIPPRPDPDDPTQNVKKDDVVNDNKNNMGFTLAGLEGVFPFCIPWDIYAFMTLLVADPVAPSFDFPIKSVNNQTEEIHVDLSPFEPVAVVVRYIFDFLFIIGLAMLTRSLIGGGSSD